MNDITVFFDIGGTLLESPDIFRIISEKLSCPELDTQTYSLIVEKYEGLIFHLRYEEERFRFKSIARLFEEVLTWLSTNYQYKDISRQARDITIDVYGCSSVLYPETLGVLEELMNKRVKMIVASHNDTAIINMQIEKHGLGKYFFDYQYSEKAKAYKPSYRFINLLKKFIVNPKRSYFVGDGEVDIESGRRLGINSILLDRKNTGVGMGSDYIIRDLKELLPLLE